MHIDRGEQKEPGNCSPASISDPLLRDVDPGVPCMGGGVRKLDRRTAQNLSRHV